MADVGSESRESWHLRSRGVHNKRLVGARGKDFACHSIDDRGSATGFDGESHSDMAPWFDSTIGEGPGEPKRAGNSRSQPPGQSTHLVTDQIEKLMGIWATLGAVIPRLVQICQRPVRPIRQQLQPHHHQFHQTGVPSVSGR